MLDVLFERITENREFYPTLAQFAEDAGEVGLETKPKPKDVPMVLFTLYGYRYACRLTFPRDVDKPGHPQSAQELVFAIPRTQKTPEEVCGPREAREAFTRGYLEAGGDPSRLEEMMRALRTQIPEEKTA